MILISCGLILLSAIINLQPSSQFTLETNGKIERVLANNENWEDALNQLLGKFEKRGFTSLGWGPGGLPYADNYYNEFSHENIIRKIKQRQIDNKLSGDIIIEPLALTMSKTAAENTDLSELTDAQRSKQKGMQGVKVKVYMPSLFKSYGWLPAGQK